MDFPLISSVGANFVYACKGLCTFWSSCSADLPSQFHRVQLSTDYNTKDRSQEKKGGGRRGDGTDGGGDDTTYGVYFENRL